MTAPKTEYRLTFASDVYLDQANNLRARIASILEREDFGSLTLLFSSDGGSTDQSLALFNFIDSLPVPLHIHAIGHIGSSAVPVFLAGAQRTCAPLARFFFHEYDWGFTGRQTLDRIDEAVKRLRSDIELARKIIQSRTKVSDDILKALDGHTSPIILEPEQAKALGFVDKICELDNSRANGMNIAVWTA